MHAMQYQNTLPANYDMDVIRERVATVGSSLDDHPGLGLKAYLMRERGVDDSPVNEYSPFYLWHTMEGMNAFLWAGGFRRLCEFFGRPVVQQWTGLAFHTGPALAATPAKATKKTWRIPPHADAAAEIERAIAETELPDGVHSTALAIDTRSWELVRFTLYDELDGADYTVLHTSTPQLADLTVGRQW